MANEDIIFDDNVFFETILGSQCDNCIFYLQNPKHNCCKAYPPGIPPEIWTGKVIHNTPYKQDNDIVYKKSV